MTPYRSIVTVGALLLFSAAASAAPVEITATRIEHFEIGNPDRVLFGRLEFRGGLVLQSNNEDFGGISGIDIAEDDDHILGVTDGGYWLHARMITVDGRLSGIADVEMAPMRGPDGKRLKDMGWGDAESIAVDGGIIYVGIERVHRILRFDIGRDGFAAHGQNVPVPSAMREMPKNDGLESLVLVPKGMPLAGTLIGISERALDHAGNIRGFLIGGPAPGVFSVRRDHDFTITDAAITTNGDLLILERHRTPQGQRAVRIRAVPLSDIRPDAIVDGEVLFEAGAQHEIDNMEAIAVNRSGEGETIITLASDNHFRESQRTLLLRFAVVEAGLSRRGSEERVARARHRLEINRRSRTSMIVRFGRKLSSPPSLRAPMNEEHAEEEITLSPPVGAAR